MPAAVPIVATIAAGVAAANEMYAIAMVITVAAQIATQALTKTPSLNSYRCLRSLNVGGHSVLFRRTGWRTG